ncbi:MAG TPA: hypothetical protein VHO70_24995 [Chitinispirillaceae bacterium]|nr:hypothetical protein [Chitinispirillaceae bacterium]
MKGIGILIAGMCLLLTSCAVLVDEPDDEEYGGGGVVNPPAQPQRIRIQTRNYFPFENNLNWWNYTESSGNELEIKVIDTISDDNILYYRVAFQEHRVDTTDDWFKSSYGSIMFGQSLTGMYEQFLPKEIDSINGTFSCGANLVRYSYYDSLVTGGVMYHGVISLKYDYPVIHGFEELLLAKGIGIVKMVDHDGRWPVTYLLDSCSVNDSVIK